MKKTTLIGAAALLAMTALFAGCASDNAGATAENGTAAKACCADKAEAKAGTCAGEAKTGHCAGEAKASTCTGEAKASGCCADKAATAK